MSSLGSSLEDISTYTTTRSPLSLSTASRPISIASTVSPISPLNQGFPFPSSDGTHDVRPALNPRHVLMRLRRVSMPANLVQTTYVAAGYTHGNGNNRLSVASFNSFESLPEEDGINSDDAEGRNRRFTDEFEETTRVFVPSTSLPGSPLLPPTLRHPTGRLPSRSVSPNGASPISATPSRRSSPQQRFSLPAQYLGGYQSFAAPLGSASTTNHSRASPLSRASSASGADLGSEMMSERNEDDQRIVTPVERKSREDRRWRVALELRETERAYVLVLKEIEEHYYLPLLAALPVSPLASRRASRNISAPNSPIIAPLSQLPSFPSSPTFPILSRMSTYVALSNSLPSVAPASNQILPRNQVSEIFSNFTDVINLSQAMLSTLESAIPDRPTEALPFHFSSRAPFPGAPELSRSAETESEDEPGTPIETTNSYRMDGEKSGGDRDRQRPRIRSRERPLPPPLKLGKALLPILPFFKSYAFFISNFASAIARLSSLESGSSSTTTSSVEDRQRWRKFCDERKAMGVGRGLSLGGLLLNVVQRVPRYRLLLSDLVKYTEVDHPDASELSAAFQVVDGVAMFLEHQIRTHTNVLQILEIQRSFVNLDFPLLIPGRLLVKSGVLRKLDSKGVESSRTFFLFNDLLLHSSGGDGGWGLRLIFDAIIGEVAVKSKNGSGTWANLATSAVAASNVGGQYRYHHRFSLQDVTIVGVEDGRDPRTRNSFEIRTPEKSFAVYADSLETKREWIETIRSTQEELLDNRRTLQHDAEERRLKAHQPLRRQSNPLTPLTPRTPSKKVSSAPRLDFIPPTPSVLDEGPKLLSTLTIVQTASITIATEATDDYFSNATAAETDIPSPPVSPARPALAPRRWSDGGAAPIARGILEAVVSASAVVEEGMVELRVIDSYSAPIWVADSKVDRCMSCREGFSLLRRRHHCRLCGGIFCYLCSARNFIIPSSNANSPDRIARSCEACFAAVFPPLSSPIDSILELDRLDLDAPDNVLTPGYFL